MQFPPGDDKDALNLEPGILLIKNNWTALNSFNPLLHYLWMNTNTINTNLWKNL